MNLNKNREDRKGEFENFINDNLSKFSAKDVYVTLTSYKLPVSITAAIIDYDNETLKIRFKNSKYMKRLTVNDPIVVNISSEDILYSASSSVISFDSIYMNLKIDKVTAKDDLRREKRFLVALKGSVEYENDKSFIIIKNLSQNGLKFFSKLNIPLNSEILITFITYEFFEVKLQGRIVQKNSLTDTHSYGISIEYIDEESLKNLNVCIRNLTDTFEL